ncbi:MAG TPA: class I SAM-dependent methyltransferase [Pyrinomonadaceae bacterium]|jgi:SAM-dependent methyltransferase
MDYDAYYTEVNLSVSGFINQRVEEILMGFSGYRQTNRLLEIGFGAGALLRAANRAGWSAEGVEISKTAAEHVREEGLTVFCGDLLEAGYPEGHFDVVVATELLEHVDDPESLVREVVRILRPGGLFWATTPHVGGVSSRLLGLDWTTVSADHLHLFSKKGLTSLLKNAGFRRVRMKTQGVDPFELWQALLQPKKFANVDSVKCITTRCGFNEALTRSLPRRLFKNFVNSLLRLSRLGDSLKIWAER